MKYLSLIDTDASVQRYDTIFYNYLYKSRANKGKEISAETMKFCILLAGLLAMAMALSQRNDASEDFFQTAIPALSEETVCPGTDDPLTLSANVLGLIEPRVFKSHLPAANLPPVSLTPEANNGDNIRLQTP